MEADRRTTPPRRLVLIEAAIGAGSSHDGCRDGPRTFRESGEPSKLARHGFTLEWRRPDPSTVSSSGSPEEVIARVAGWVAEEVMRAVDAGLPFVVFGGDHSCAIGTWGGLARAVGPRKLGLVWIDAHMDMHRPETTHSGLINGMPLACLMGYGAPALVNAAGLEQALDPRHVCLVGVRSFEPEEPVFARELGVRVIGIEEVRRRGLADALAEAREIASRGTAGYGVSLDLDALDPEAAPAVGTPEAGGLSAAELSDAWPGLVLRPECLGLEVTEYNPSLDVGGRTLSLAGELIAAAAFPREFARRG